MVSFIVIIRYFNTNFYTINFYIYIFLFYLIRLLNRMTIYVPLQTANYQTHALKPNPGHLNPAQALTTSAQALTRARDPQPSIFAPNLPRHRGVLLPPSPSRRRSENTPIADLDPPGSIDFANASFSDSLIFVSSFWA